MGGGDLNLKKSWHPSTLRNIERVWKAEEKHKAEKEKIEQLQKELAAERDREEIRAHAVEHGVVQKQKERLDWMYQGPASMVNREDYLMGRKIDKTLELLEMQETGKEPPKEEDSLPGTTLFFQSTSTVTVDLANKIREDPLFAIKKKEKEQKKSLLNNPVKMKQLQQMLQQSLVKNDEKKKKKKSKKQMKKKAKYESESSSSSSSEESEQSDTDKRKRIHSKNRDKNHKYDDKERKQRYHHHQRNEEIKNGYDSDDRSNAYKSHSRHSRDNSSQAEHHSYYSSSNSEHKRHRDRGSESSKVKDDYKNPSESKRARYNHHDKQDTKKKMSAEERERRLQEMMDNAKWRENQRQQIVQKYDAEIEKEEKMKRDDPAHFIKPMLSQAAEKCNLEGRLKQNIFTIQRNKADMDKNFARR